MNTVASSHTMTPSEIVSELDKHIVGQTRAKRAVAVALRNRWRRAQVAEPLRTEITPKNILMIGPTGVGKTEIARRLARLANAPFIKVEATKFTEVGYVGRDVDSIIRDLMDAAMVETRARLREAVAARAAEAAEDRVIEAIAGTDAREATREMFRRKLRAGELADTMIEVDLPAREVVDDEDVVSARGQVQRRRPTTKAVAAQNDDPHVRPSPVAPLRLSPCTQTVAVC